MNVVFIFLLFVIIGVAILILIDRSGRYDAPTSIKGLNGEEKKKAKALSKFVPSAVWGQPVPYPNPDQNVCYTYTFIGGTYEPAAPSYNKLNQDERSYYVAKVNNPSSCLDVDQLYAQQITIECENPQGISAGSGCFVTVPTYDFNAGTVIYPGVTGSSNGTVSQGTIQGKPYGNLGSNLYGQCLPSTASQGSVYCSGDIGLVIPYFTPQVQYDVQSNQCLNGIYDVNYTPGTTGSTGSTGSFSLSSSYYNVDMQPCDLSVPGQIFRVTRYSLDSQGNLNEDDNGNLASIVHRYTGYYLAPKLEPVVIQEPNRVINTYDFTKPIYNYVPGGAYDKYQTDIIAGGGIGLPYYVYGDLILINPQFDTYRNGIYWLLQNRTFNLNFGGTTSDINLYIGEGIYVNQTNYTAEYPNGQSNPSYYAIRSAATWAETNPPINLLAGGPLSNCAFGIPTPAPGQVTTGSIAIDSDMAPQQIVYVPDIRLLPTNNQDPESMWNYLINNLSINLKADGTPFLTPYRTSSKTDVYYGCTEDSNYAGANYFTYLIGNISNLDYPLPDAQFINYSSYVSQIQIPVDSLELGPDVPPLVQVNPNYASKSNPFVTQ